MTKVKYDAIGQFIRSNGLVLSLQIISVVVLLANLWLATKLAPLASGIEKVATRVDAIEKSDADGKPYLERFIQLETKVESLTKSVDGVGNKIDSIIQRNADVDAQLKAQQSLDSNIRGTISVPR